MAEGLVTNLIKLLVSTVAREVEQEIRLVVGVDKEAKKNLKTIYELKVQIVCKTPMNV